MNPTESSATDFPQNATRVKICGMTNLDDARVAAESGADLLGFIFYPKSPRAAQPHIAAEIITILKQEYSTLKTVGVFVNESVEHIQNMQHTVGFDYAQLHGGESVEMVNRFGRRAFKVLRPATKGEANEQASHYATLGPLDGPTWMLDAYDPNLYGGTGHKTDWETAAQLARQYPGLLLAGGLTPENVVQAIAAVQPWGIDLASGVEAEPGRKDHAQVRALMDVIAQLNHAKQV